MILGNKAALTVIISFLIILGSCSYRNENNYIEEVKFAEGDLVFRKGFGAKSGAVLHADASGIYSHVGIVVRQDSVFKVVHITPGERAQGETEDRIKIESPEEFFSNAKAKCGAVYRLEEILPYAENAAKQALRLLQKDVLFDHDYQLDDSTKMYCTELVWYVYQLAGTDISDGKRSELNNFPIYSGTYIFPSDIYTNKYFQLIYQF